MASQKEWDLYFLQIAEAVAIKSRCVKRQVGTVIVDKNKRICATGFNDKPRHCDVDNIECKRLNIPSGQQENILCCNHSEASALIFANFNDIQDGTIYITCAPCSLCSLLILQSGIKRLVFYEDTRLDGISLLKEYTFKSKRLEIVAYKKYSKSLVGEKKSSFWSKLWS